MEKLQGNGRPSNTLKAEVGQLYEDLNTGDIYECRVASEHSRLHGPIIGGYVWERRARGEDIQDHEAIYGGGSGSSSGAQDPLVIEINYGGTAGNLSWTSPSTVSVLEMIAAIESGRQVLLDYVNGESHTVYLPSSYGHQTGDQFVGPKDFVFFSSGREYFNLQQYEDESSFGIIHTELAYAT